MKYTRKIISSLFLLVIITSCSSYNKLYRDIKKNSSEFVKMSEYLKKIKVLKSRNDLVFSDGLNLGSSKHKCVYQDNEDKKISDFILKYELDEICEYDEHFELIFFIESRPAYFSKARVIFDGGKSTFRKKIEKGNNVIDGFKYEIINSYLIYVQR